MFDPFIPEHHIQKHIIGVLMHQKYVRFRDMRPPKVDTNLYSYHLKILLKRGLVIKSEFGYTLGKNGLIYVDRVSTKTLKYRNQPKIITMLVVQNSDGRVLLYKRRKQPYLEKWTLPYGKQHITDPAIVSAASREAKEKLGIDIQLPEHAGDCYIRVVDNGEIIMSTLAHVFRFESDDITESDFLKWVKPHKLAEYDLAPAVEEIVARTFFRDPHFFEEYEAPLG